MTAASTPMRPVTRPAAGTAAAAIAVTMWGASSIFVKEIDTIDGLAVPANRLLVGTALTLVAFALNGGRLTRRLLWTCLPGGLAFGIDVALFFAAIRSTSVANATVIGALQPVLMLVVAPRLFGEDNRRGDVGWALLAVGGTGVVVLGASASGVASARGDLLAVGALFAWTWYFVASKTARQQVSSLDYLAGAFVVATVALVPLALLTSDGFVPGDTSDWVLLVALSGFSGGFGHFLMAWAHGHIRLQVASVLTLGVPVVSTVAAALVLHETVRVVQIGGMVVVLGALAMVVLGQRRPPAAAPLTPLPEE